MASDGFCSIMHNFMKDLTGTFPELLGTPYILEMVEKPIEEAKPHYETVFLHITTTVPPACVFILNQNEELFATPFFLLPEVDFSLLWNDRTTEHTKQTMWKYLKLVMLSVMDHVNKDISGMLNETTIQKMIDDISKTENTEGIADKFKGLIDGKIGDLAKEIAAETIGTNPDEQTIKNIMSSPSGISSLVGSVGEKITSKIQSGELKESELLEEATQMLSKLKDMPGMSQFEEMFSKLGKINVPAMQAKMNQDIKKAKTKERLQDKLAKRKEKK